MTLIFEWIFVVGFSYSRIGECCTTTTNNNTESSYSLLLIIINDLDKMVRDVVMVVGLSRKKGSADGILKSLCQIPYYQR